MFDGLTHGCHHYVAIFAVYDGTDGCQEGLIGLLEQGLTADAHAECLKSVLSVYNKDISVVKFLVVDSCPTNQSMAKG